MARPTPAELRAIGELLDKEWEDVEELAMAVAELRDSQREKRCKWMAVAQEVDPHTGLPTGEKPHGGSPRGHTAGFPPLSTYKQAEKVALAATYNANKMRTAHAWVVPVYPTPAQWWRDVDKEIEGE